MSMAVRHSDSSAKPTPTSSGKRWLKRLLWLVVACVAVLVLAIGGVLVWASSDGSLPRALQLAQKFLPKEQSLAFDNAQGSITGGGTVAQLQWAMPGVAVDVAQFNLDWSLSQLLSRRLDVRTLAAERVHVRLSPTPTIAEPDPTPFVMPERISLPLQLSVPLQVGQLAIERVAVDGSSHTETIDNIGAHYRFDGVQHALELSSLQYGQSHLQAQLSLGAEDLAVQAAVGAWLSDLVPDVPLTMHARLNANGTLAGGDAASLQLKLDGQEQPAGAVWSAEMPLLQALPTAVPTAQEAAAPAESDMTPEAAPTEVPRAHNRRLAGLQLDAQVHPWRSQPIQTALLALQRINGRAFHAAAPETDLNGTLRVDPDNAAGAAVDLANASWQLQAQLSNQLPGPWDQALLPVKTLDAQIHYSADRIAIEQAQVGLEGSAAAGQLQAKGTINLQHLADTTLALELVDVNLLPLMQGLPQTAFSGAIELAPQANSLPLEVTDLAQAHWSVQADLRNSQAGMVDKERVPLTQLLAKAQIEPERWVLETAEAHVEQGKLQLQGYFEPNTQQLDVSGEVSQLPLVLMHSELAAEQVPNLNGKLAVAGQLDKQVHFDVDIGNAQSGSATASRWNINTLALKGLWSPTLLEVERVQLDAFAAKVEGRSIKVTLPEADSIEAVLQATAPGLSLNADTDMQHSSGRGQLALQVLSAPQLLEWLRGLPVVGSQLPAMRASGKAQLEAEWQGGWQQWLAELQTPTANSKVQFNANLTSDGLQFAMAPTPAAPTNAARNTKAKADKNAADKAAADKARVATAQAASTATDIDVRQLALQLSGNPTAAQLSMKADVLANGTQALFNTQAQLAQITQRNATGPVWRIVLEQLALAATLPDDKQAWSLQLSEPLQATLQTGSNLQLNASAGQLSLTPPPSVSPDGAAMRLQWEPIVWSQRANGAMNLQTQGQLHGLVLTWLDGLLPSNPPLKTAGIDTDLIFSGGWNVRMAETIELQAFLKRDSGDIWLGDPVVEQITTGPADNEGLVKSIKPLPGKGQAVGIQALELRAQSRGNALELSFDWDTQKAGVIKANAQTNLSQQAGSWTLAPDAPLRGSVQATMQDLGIWTGLAPLGWRISGALDADITLGGQLNAPVLRGPITGNNLNLRSVLDGVELHEGRLRAELAGNRLNVSELVFQGGTGSNAYVRGLSGNRTPAPTARGQMTASGFVDWSQAATADNSGIAMDFKAQLDAMQVLVRSDRQMSLSGNLDATLNNGQMRVRGDINVVRASITLPSSGAPTLSSDVVVVRHGEPVDESLLAQAQLQSAKPMDLNLKLNLGRDFALEGYGITTRLEGELTIRNSTRGNDPVSIVGEVRTDEGRYRAWGQALDVETGEVLFNGPYDNPSINLLAVRPNTPVDITAGVRVTGTAQSPRVQLYSNPTMPDSETLSWVLLGRAPNAGSGDSNAMQQAALGLLANSVGSSLAEGFGFDSVGLGQNGLEIGKRLSDQLYVSYQSGLAGAATTFYVFYDITQRLTLRGQTGTDSAVDLIYTFSYDGKEY
ncbi:hypothetical protein E8K88_06010 [Lampropedia aestuarii]|uniref:Translocation and assembly module TamB C-terminal domain-containing protein n=2 Tax=Lampropedia aestuarii TaxID=2562762 RepID=A0A4S5BU66_9BURK|nr:hypothetical protein E8K88_06010 [Lampropedia aestuarii]